MEKLGSKLKKIREVHGYSQEYVAFELGVSQAAYSKKENGFTELSLTCLMKLAELYRITISDLISMNTQEILIKVIRNNQFVS